MMLKHFNLEAKDVIFFGHDEDVVKIALTVGITTFHYDKNKSLLISKISLWYERKCHVVGYRGLVTSHRLRRASES